MHITWYFWEEYLIENVDVFNVWPNVCAQALFGRDADKLERANDDEATYYIIEDEPLVNKYISVPKDKGSLNCAVFIAGIIEAVLNGCGFVSIPFMVYWFSMIQSIRFRHTCKFDFRPAKWLRIGTRELHTWLSLKIISSAEINSLEIKSLFKFSHVCESWILLPGVTCVLL